MVQDGDHRQAQDGRALFYVVEVGSTDVSYHAALKTQFVPNSADGVASRISATLIFSFAHILDCWNPFKKYGVQNGTQYSRCTQTR